ncbi:MAG TPA: autotransporter outer membrane beta-barrel domain-containing protein [Steroidobacteraceae bacterium]|nr:autotransporter outer membrane beta-barrel domain-containing protein [Steroidobacteraceae bacterium]
MGGGGGNGGFSVAGVIAGGGVGAAGVSVGLGGAGGGGGAGGIVNATLTGSAHTRGDNATAVVAQSIGGGGGNGGFNVAGAITGAGSGAGGVAVGFGGSGGAGGASDQTTLAVTGDVLTEGDDSGGVLAQSVGGGGGNGGFNVSGAISGSGSTSGAVAVGFGGSGGSGAHAGGAVSASVTGNIVTMGSNSTGLTAQSIGGGGGNGGFNVSGSISGSGGTSGAVSVGLGGSGGGGGDASLATATLTGNLQTFGADSDGVLVQSIGGGGGNGGFNVSSGISGSGSTSGAVAVGLGGAGGGAGTGGEVRATVTGNVVTAGDNASSIIAQSVGGGGGNGGFNVSGAVSGAGSTAFGVSVGLGGAGGGGGSGGVVTATVTGDAGTQGANATAVVVQSLGGGGGNGGMNVTGTVAGSGSGSGGVTVGLGGSGGGGGDAGLTTLVMEGDVVTTGADAGGILVQAVGGGGGNGGMNVSSTLTGSGSGSGAVSVGLGGSGGVGGDGAAVSSTVTGDLYTQGDRSTGYVAQSLGGGGGNGGLNVTGALAASGTGAGAVALGLGGSGGGGGDGRAVDASLTGNLTTLGDDAHGVLFQSVGGGGGNGGINVSAAVSAGNNGSGALAVGVGGAGGGGGDSAAVVGTVTGNTATGGDRSFGVLMQSVGGGGGNGGMNISGALSLSKGPGGALGVGVGGFGGAGGEAATVTGTVTGAVLTTGNSSTGVLAQSVGGGGGNGGMNVSGALSIAKESTAAAAIGVGGFGGGPGNGHLVTLTRTGATTTTGASSDGVVAQSIGGGGGNGGMNISGALSGSTSGTAFSAALGLGGFGGGGGDGGDVIATVDGDVSATGHGAVNYFVEDAVLRREITQGSNGVLAQSVGGSGGNGAINISGGIALASPSQGHSYGLTLGVGGFGGSGGDAGAVRLDVTADNVASVGDQRFGVGAQSIGGGGGNGGMNVSGGIVMDGQMVGGVGGFGGAGGEGRDVTASATTSISAVGANAIGFLAQSIGGGGGNGGMNVSGGIQASRDAQTPSLVFGIGGFGGAGNISGDVVAHQRGDIAVGGSNSFGVLAQSVAGGGGNGALNVSGNAGQTRGYNAALGVGGSAGAGANAGAVSLFSDGNILVDGSDIADPGVDPDYNPSAFDLEQMGFRERANGVLAQSIGGGGGNGGMNVSGVGSINGNPITAGVGGSGSTGGDAGAVFVSRGALGAGVLATSGNNADGLTAQSIGGGGGNAGMNFLFSNTAPATRDRPVTAVMLGVGGSGGAAGDGNIVDVRHTGTIVTEGDNSTGIVAQSVGGGGGSATFNIGLGNNKDAKAFNIALGGGTGNGGIGRSVDVVHTGDISTEGDVSNAIFAQSVGGGGGSTGMDMVTSPRSARGVDIGIGRSGGTGGAGGDVFVNASGMLTTEGDRSIGIRAQSVGNGGGDSSSNSIEVSGEGPSGPDGEAQDGQDWSASMEVGIDGGVGGEAGDVEVFASGAIRTQGIAAHGIYAQSVGGGGGAGGALERHGLMEAANQVSIGVGGHGGIGGTSGVVSVDNDAVIQTTGDDSHGVFAQSIAGGGGLGGYIAQLDTSIGGGAGGANFSVQMGGVGGEGAEADEVIVNNTGTIVTSGRRSFGIDAQSVGGGGGEGGAIVSAGITRGSNSRNVSMNLGGSGGEGGTGDAVTVTNEGRIDTTGDESVGIRAQSVGGKGGDAGLMLELGIIALTSNQEATNIAIKVGGTGGTGASSGDVEVVNSAVADEEGTGIITTGGRAAHGIFAQSLGGGGGNGSSIITSNLGASSQGQATLVNLSVGGSGGEGGTAGDVTVTNDSLIETGGEEAHGVFAQSIGGGGGNGGLALAANAVLAQGDVANEAMIALGGSGGHGDDAGNVTVNNNDRIVTHGARSHGIFAQSIGGGGGNAGIGFGASTNPATMVLAGAMSATFGGEGGEGGLGGEVTVNHSGNITVFGENSHAVVAESINGGGGHLALDFRGVSSLPGLPPQIFNLIPLPDGTDSAPVIEFNGGGVDQQDSDAGRVTLNYTGTFGVAGNNGAANAVQAIGGGGGTFDLNLVLNDAAGSVDDVQVEGRLGGVSGTNNRGGDISSLHDGDLVTEGDNTPGALVQSIGGGGGRANLALNSSFDSIDVTSLTLGGQDGNQEEGGDIDHTQTGSVRTQGVTAHGGVFQSIGGGGGALTLLASGDESAQAAKAARREKLDAGAAAQAASAHALLVPSLRFGSAGGSVLSGGDVSLDLDGDVETAGDNSIGMIFQSVGAGGGIASVLGVDGLNVSIGGSNGASGDGGVLEVQNTGDVVTAGLRSHGVFLQSIGGGGSAVFTDAAAPSVTLSAANRGDGGDILFEQNGTIATSGDHAYSLFAQSVGGGGGFVDGAFAASAGGEGSAGAIDLALNGDIAAMGEFSTALFAQSTGANGLGGNITATLAAGNQLLGGENGVAVYYDGGAANSFTNRGTVRTLTGLQGFAFRGGAGGDSIANHGTVIGNVDLGAGANGFANHVDGTFYTANTINLGAASNVLRNDGVISPGADRQAMNTRLSGSFVQSATGTSNMEINLATRQSDRISATGTAHVAGTVNVSLLNTQNIRSGVSFYPLYSATGGANDLGIAFNPQESIVIDYWVRNQGASDLGVLYDVDFAAEGLIGNRVAVGEYLNRVQVQGDPGGLGDTITAAVLETSLEDYAFMLTQLGTEFYAEQQVLALNGVQRFARNLQNCGTTTIGETAGDETGCYWVRYDDNPSSRKTWAGFPAAEDESYSISQGVQVPGDGAWSFGFGLDFEDHRTSGFNGLWTSDSKFIQFGASTRRDLGAGSIGATLALGHNSQSVSRLLGVTEATEASGERNLMFLSNVLDYTYEVGSGGFVLQPSFSLGTSFLKYGDMTEQGAQSQNAVIHGDHETHLWVEPAIGGRYVANFGSGASLRTFARVGLLQFVSGTSTRVHAGLEGASPGAAPMNIGSDLDRTHVVGEAGLQFQTPGGFTLGLSYTQQESEIREGGAGSLRFVLPLQ